MPNGHPGTVSAVTNNGGYATDNSPMLCLNAVGTAGSKDALRGFADALPK
jgi:hypothetical protein